MEDERRPLWEYWRLVAEYIAPRRYTWLSSPTERVQRHHLYNTSIFNNTATLAARTLAAGMMNGITSPARPWFRIRAPGLRDVSRVTRWLESVQEDMLSAMAETNFYNGMAQLYGDLAVFHTGAMTIYEDPESVFRCYNYPLGEYYISHNNRQVVDRFAREFMWNVEKTVNEFGLENCSEAVQRFWRDGGPGYREPVKICHMIEPNGPEYKDYGVPRMFPFREIYWDKEDKPGRILRVKGYNEWPTMVPRWQLIGDSPYGGGPTHDALPDIRQLQLLEKLKIQGLEKLIRPPLVADVQLQNRPTALLPDGITYVAGINNVGMKPVYQVAPPIQEMMQDIQRLEKRIEDTYYVDLFRMISQLETVRSATEIDARREEKLILLGPVLDAFQNEALDPAIKRIFGIMYRNGMFAPEPPELEDQEATVEYDSILSDARRALDAAPMERGAQFIGNLAAAVPEAIRIPDWPSYIRDYLQKIGVPEQNIRDPEEVMEEIQRDQQGAQVQQAAEVAQPAAQSAKLLSETQVGGASDALSLILGNQ
jgi:hypothetical protein